MTAPAVLAASSVRNGRIVFAAERFAGSPGIVAIGSDGRGRRNLTHHSDSVPVLSRDGRRIAFTRVDQGGENVFVMNADGGDQHQVAAGGASPSWSPDGRRLAYIGGANQVAVVDLATGKSRFITAQTSSLPVWASPVWSPDGAHIAAFRDDALVVMRPDGSDVRVLVDTGTDAATGFSWSRTREGTRLVYLTYAGFLRVVDVETGRVKTLGSGVQSPTGDLLSSPDGKTIAYTASSRTHNCLAVFVVSLSGGPPRYVICGFSLAAWSPNSRAVAIVYGNQIAVVSVDNGRRRWVTHEPPASSISPPVAWGANNTIFFAHSVSKITELISIDSNGTHARAFTHASLSDRDPAWSPNGREIAFTRQLTAKHAEVFVMGSDGGHVRQLTVAPDRNGIDAQPTWSPDGKRIAFLSSENGGSIDTIRADGRDRKVVGGIVASDLRWSPDGKRLLFSVDDPAAPGSDNLLGRLVVVMPADGGDDHAIAQGSQPDWSPDGREVVFVHVDACGDECDATSLHVVNSDGTGEHAVPGTSGLFGPHYSPDGRFIIASGSKGIVILTLAGSVVQTIPVAGTDQESALPQTSWQPVER